MYSKVNYTIVGVFVLLFSIGVFGLQNMVYRKTIIPIR